MKAADLATLIVVLLLGGGVMGGFFYWKGEQARAEELAYEQIIDEAIDRDIETFGLTPLLATLAAHDGERLETLRALYADPIKRDGINLGYGNLQGDWPTTYGHIAGINNRTTDRGRFEAEVDERFGAGAYRLMQAEYEAFLAEENNNPTAIGSREERERQQAMWALRSYLRAHDRYPEGRVRVENGRLIEEPISETPSAAAP
jgi:hypothetical protein